jgi:hypothetical protein
VEYAEKAEDLITAGHAGTGRYQLGSVRPRLRVVISAVERIDVLGHHVTRSCHLRLL